MADKKKPLSELSDRELRDMGNTALKNMSDLYEDKRAGKEITADREKQVDDWELETRAVEQEVNKRRIDNSFAALSAGPKIPGTDTESDEKFDPNFKPSQRSFNAAIRKFEQRERKLKYLNPEERKILQLNNHEERAFESLLRAGLKVEKLGEEERAIINNMETRAQSLTTTAGGFTVLQGFIPKVILYLKYIS